MEETLETTNFYQMSSPKGKNNSKVLIKQLEKTTGKIKNHLVKVKPWLDDPRGEETVSDDFENLFPFS